MDVHAQIAANLVVLDVALNVLAHQRCVVRFGVLPAECGSLEAGTPYVQVNGGSVFKGRTVGEALIAWLHTQTPHGGA